MNWSSLAVAALGCLICASCTDTQTRQAVQVAADVQEIDQCSRFQAAKNTLHDRLSELETDDLERLIVINRDGEVHCTSSLIDLISELEAIAGRLP